MEPGHVKVNVLYSSIEYDEFIGTVIEIPQGSCYKIGMNVCIILDYNKRSFVLSPNLSSIIVSEECVFELPYIHEDYLSLIVPLIKYGVISFYIIQNYNVTNDTRICIDSQYNIYKAFTKFFKNKLEYHETSRKSFDGASPNILISMKDNILDIDSFDKTHTHVDFNYENIMKAFGKNNVIKVVEYIIKNNIIADVVHICRGDSLSKQNSRSRFFDIINIHI